MVNVGKYTVRPMDAMGTNLPRCQGTGWLPLSRLSPFSLTKRCQHGAALLHVAFAGGHEKTLEQLSEHVWFIDSWHTMYFDLPILRIYMYMHCICLIHDILYCRSIWLYVHLHTHTHANIICFRMGGQNGLWADNALMGGNPHHGLAESF